MILGGRNLYKQIIRSQTHGLNVNYKLVGKQSELDVKIDQIIAGDTLVCIKKIKQISKSHPDDQHRPFL